MTVFEQIAFAFQALFRSLFALRRPATWLPWLPLAAAGALLVALAWNFAHPLLSPLMVPWITRVAGEDALHYPGLFAALPLWFAKSNLVPQMLLGPLAIGAGVVVFAQLFRGLPVRPASALAAALARWPMLVLAQLPFHALIAALTLGLAPWLGEHKHGLVIRLFARVAILGGATLAETLLFFVAVLIMVTGRGLFEAFAEIPGALMRGFVAAVVLGCIPVVTRLGLQALETRSATIVTRGVPELVGALTLADIALSLLAWYVLAGAATMVYLGAMQHASEVEDA